MRGIIERSTTRSSTLITILKKGLNILIKMFPRVIRFLPLPWFTYFLLPKLPSALAKLYFVSNVRTQRGRKGHKSEIDAGKRLKVFVPRREDERIFHFCKQDFLVWYIQNLNELINDLIFIQQVEGNFWWEIILINYLVGEKIITCCHPSFLLSE